MLNAPRWLSGKGVVLLSPMTLVRFLAAAPAVLVATKSGNAGVFEISVHVKGPQVANINPELFNTARHIPSVLSAR